MTSKLRVWGSDLQNVISRQLMTMMGISSWKMSPPSWAQRDILPDFWCHFLSLTWIVFVGPVSTSPFSSLPVSMILSLDVASQLSSSWNSDFFYSKSSKKLNEGQLIRVRGSDIRYITLCHMINFSKELEEL